MKRSIIFFAISFAALMATYTVVAKPIDAPIRESFFVESENENLYLQVSRPAESHEPGPVVLFLFGSGEFSTTRTYEKFLRFFFEEPLLKKGFTIASFDKRGTGKSSGTWYNTSFEQRAVDAANVARFLHNQDWVDPKKVFVAGHSQGGWITQIALAEYPALFAGGISMAGPTFSVREQLINDYASGYQCDDDLDEKAAYRKATSNVDWTLRFVSWFGWWGNLKQLKIIKDFSPDSYLQATTAPLLLMFAENDPLVSPEHSIQTLNELFPAGIPQHIHYFVGANQEHAFKIAPKCYSGDWQKVHYSETSRDQMIEWLLSQV
ncbi:alpha/beta hydrolase family protein [Idiomarina aquatica]|jgi:dipeptidyl aminopeptidase/acylaminoacyl peptidase|uniref:Peptidase S9 prolyl oligopeptidase catalytic domain-containing protein n=1 Tax=Idiomarina aquatica TaxID=1327752 RepID=A0AA94JD76_9GAMM|nr:alpha/beta fold hydrolase [Idiomarina aquatica]RUO42587.1 hypothetical protein CWE23_10935 [Idiomarina aquatica]